MIRFMCIDRNGIDHDYIINLMINIPSTRFISLTNHLIYNSSFIDYSQSNGFGKLILNKPKALNSLNLEMVQRVTSLLPEIS